MLKSLILVLSSAAAVMVVLGRPGAAMAEPLFRAIEINAKLYESSFTELVALAEDGSAVSQEWNDSMRGFIQNHVYDPTTESILRFDDVVGRPSMQMPAGPIGGARFGSAGVEGGFAYRYPRSGPTHIFSPTGPIGSGAGVSVAAAEVGYVFNAAHSIQLDSGGTLRLWSLPPDASQPSSQAASITIPNYAAGLYGEVDSMNRDSRVAGFYPHAGTPDRLHVFAWEPDLSDATTGTFRVAEIERPVRGTILTTRQSLNGEPILINISNSSPGARYPHEALLWTPGEEIILLNDRLGRPYVEVYDINSAGLMVGVAADADGGNAQPFLYSLDAGYHAFDLSMIDPATTSDWTRFTPTFINDAGQLGGVARYTQTLSNGATQNACMAAVVSRVPEPAQLAALSMITAFARRRRNAS